MIIFGEKGSDLGSFVVTCSHFYCSCDGVLFCNVPFTYRSLFDRALLFLMLPTHDMCYYRPTEFAE